MPSSTDFKHLDIYTRDHGEETSFSRFLLTDGDAPIFVVVINVDKKQYIHLSSAISLRKNFPDVEFKFLKDLPATQTHVDTKLVGQDVILDNKRIILICQKIIHQGWSFCEENIQEKTEGLINILLAPFMSLPDFESSLRLYKYEPDENVKFLYNETESQTFLSNLLDRYKLRIDTDLNDDSYTISEIHAITMLQTLSFRKAYISSEHASEFRTKRCSALANTLKSKSLLSKDTTDKLIDDYVMERLHNYWNFFPKLQSIIYQFILARKDIPVCGYMEELLKEVQLTSFSLVYRFLTSNIKTKLHVERTVLSEMAHWIQAFKKLKVKYGDHWPYFRLFDPSSQEVNMKRFPNLAAASFAYNLAYDRKDSIGNLKGIARNALRGYLRLATQEIDPRFLTEDSERGKLYDEMAEHEGFLGIKVSDPNIAFKDVDEENYKIVIGLYEEIEKKNRKY